MADIIRLDEATVFDAGMNPAPKKYLEIRDGEEIIHKPTQAASEKWVNADGGVIAPNMVTGAGNFDIDGPYAAQKRRRLRDTKCIPYAECPLRNPEYARFLPESIELEWAPKGEEPQEITVTNTDQPCDPGTYGRAHACPHVEAIIKVRSKKNSDEWERIEMKFKSMDDIRKDEWLKKHGV